MRRVRIALAVGLLALAPAAPALAAPTVAPAVAAAAATDHCVDHTTAAKVNVDDSPATVTVTDTTTGDPIEVVVTITGTTFEVTPVDPSITLVDASWCVKSSTGTNSGTGTEGASTSTNKKGVVQNISYVVLYSVSSEDTTIVPCNQSSSSGGQGTTVTVYELGTAGPTSFQVQYEMYNIPDQLDITYEGSTIFTTGGLVSGGATETVAVPAGSSTQITVTVSAPNAGTAWDYTVFCPAA